LVRVERAAAIARSLPDVIEGERHGTRTWFAAGKAFAWERQYSKADLRRFAERGELPPPGPILAIRTRSLDEKDAILAVELPGFFTIPHFDGYAGLLIQLDLVEEPALRDALQEAWRAVTAKLRRQPSNPRGRRNVSGPT
jgi:hypothetical protein